MIRTCINCGDEFTQGTFYIYHSAIGGKANNVLGGVHFCRPCMKKKYEQMNKED